MFTPQRKPFLTTDRKGKPIAFVDETPTDDWQKFKEVGLLDEASLERKDYNALVEKFLNLEKELFDYQHNMGLLLIEKKKWTLRNEQLEKAFDEANEILKRERTSKLIALNECEKREENLRKGLLSEKQYVVEIKRELEWLRKEHLEMKLTYETKLSQVNALVVSSKESSLEVDRKNAIVEEKLAVVERKSFELEKKVKDVKTREKALRREHLSQIKEREAYDAAYYKQREELNEWEKKLELEEKRLCEGKRSFNHLEERERGIKSKEKTLEETQRKIDVAMSELIHLKDREESINIKEKELNELEEKLIARERETVLEEMEERVKEKERKLVEESERLLEDKESLCKLKDEIEEIGVEATKQQSRIQEESEALRVTKEERLEFVRLQSEVKRQEELLLKEIEDVRQDKQRFEKEWESLDEKKAEITFQKEREELSIEKNKLEKEKAEIVEDVTKVDELRLYVKKQEEELQCRKERFEVFLNEIKNCSTCGEKYGKFLSGKQIVEEEHEESLQFDDHEPSQSFTESRIQEGSEVSLQSDVKEKPSRRGRGRGKSVRGTKAVSTTPRKRQREQVSRMTESGHVEGDSDEEGVDSVMTGGGRRKKRQTAVPVSLTTPGQSRYHLRRHRNVGTEEDKAQESVNGDNLTTPQVEVLVKAVTHEEIVKVEAETEFKDNNIRVEEPRLESGGIGERRENGDDVDDDDENMGVIGEEENGEEEEEETERTGEASIGKKIWVFFTT